MFDKSYYFFWLTVGSTVALVAAPMMQASISVIVGLGVIVVGCYSVGIWQWLSHFEWGSRLEDVSRKQQQELFLKIAGVVLFLLIVISGAVLHYRLFPPAADEELKEAYATIDRYRKMLGIDSNTGLPTLIELSNGELKKKGTLLIQNIRALNSYYEKQISELQASRDRKEMGENKFGEDLNKIMNSAGEEFTKNLRTESLRTLQELRNRIPKEQRRQFIAVPDINSADTRDPPVSLYGVFEGLFSFSLSLTMANEMEMLVKLLPDT